MRTFVQSKHRRLSWSDAGGGQITRPVWKAGCRLFHPGFAVCIRLSATRAGEVRSLLWFDRRRVGEIHRLEPFQYLRKLACSQEIPSIGPPLDAEKSGSTDALYQLPRRVNRS